jgi:hypothetical protein
MAKKTTASSKTTAAKKTTSKTRATTTSRKPATAKATTSKTKAKTTSKKPTTKKPTTKKQEFSDVEIAMKAYDIYKTRIARGEKGHSDDDWHKAVEELRKGKK